MNITEPISWKHYTVGFYFDETYPRVLVIRKAKPVWQAGRLNGIGGSFEEEDTNNSSKCMAREFCEETGQSEYGNRASQWTKFAEGEVRCHQGDCFLHYMVTQGPGFLPKRVNNEECVWIELATNWPLDIVPNLVFLIPMARNAIVKPWWSEIATFRTII